MVASVEARFEDRQGWRNPTSALVSYLKFLAASGYGLSAVEAEVAASADRIQDD